ncbi:hypothetical protein DKY63_21120 [Pseudomonas putida]|uniref:Uncharacterized protein n=1 Tax=Pseudomonas putida TaxID=303 RepID=A0A2Z4RMC8_PSEPU|nr:hypothetical protein [Pseudomonas putida]AWY42270.1 hypothetical protein DKY63_21120 [Pseudomonas putida]
MPLNVLQIEKLFSGDSVAPFLAEFVRMGDDHGVRVYSLAQNYWYFRFKAPHHMLEGHERNPFWVRRTLEQCRTWGCPVPFWALDYVMRAAANCAGYPWSKENDERRAEAFVEAIRKSSVSEKHRKYDLPWGELPKFSRQERKRVKAAMADLQGENTSEETSMRLLTAAEKCWSEWAQFVTAITFDSE